MRKNKKELIREAAVRVMAEEGYYNTKAAQIAEEAGVAVGTIYNYFKGKNEILDYIFAVELEKRLNMLKEVKEENMSFWDVLYLFLERHFQEIKRNPDLGNILVREKEFPRKKGSPAIKAYLNKLPANFESLLKKAVTKGEIRPCSCDIVSAAIFGSIQGIVERAVSDDNLGILDHAADELINIFKGKLTE